MQADSPAHSGWGGLFQVSWLEDQTHLGAHLDNLSTHQTQLKVQSRGVEGSKWVEFYLQVKGLSGDRDGLNSFNKCFLSTYSVPGTMLAAPNKANKKIPVLLRFAFCWEVTDDKQNI